MKYVFGHKTPDTDAIVSSVAYAKFLNNTGTEAKAVKLGEINNETKFVLEKAGIEEPETIESLPENSEVVLTDHNEEKQTISNIKELNIDTIIDHHKFNLQTSSPVNIRAEKIGSSCSVLYKIFSEQSYEISKSEAILLISGIISDTLYFRSPTTTKEDKEIVDKLKEISEIQDTEKYSLEMFEAKSDLGDIETEKLVKLDYKEFEFNKGKYGVGVIETTNPKYSLERKEEIIKEMKNIKEKENLDGIFLSVVDILEEDNKTIVSDEHDAEIIEKTFNGEKIEDNVYSLGNIVSRKKQIIPVLEKNLS